MDYKEAQKIYPGWKYPEVIFAFDNIVTRLMKLANANNLPPEERNKIVFDLVTLEHHLIRWCK